MTYQPSRILQRDPAASPLIALDDLKAHLRIEHEADDDYLAGLLDAAVSFFEFETKTVIVPAMLRIKLDRWPADRVLSLPRPPLRFIDRVDFCDAAGQLQTLPAAEYQIDQEARPGLIKFAETLPELQNRFAAVTIDYGAGFGLTADGTVTTAPDMMIQGIKLLVGSWYENRADTSDRRVNPTPIAVDRIIDQFKYIEVPG